MRAVFIAGLCLALGLALANCATPPREDEDPFNLHIAIGRWNAMVSQVAHLHRMPQQDYIPDSDLLAPRVLARRLREAVWFYNLQRLQLCAREHLVPETCGPPWQPGWLNDPPEEAPSFRTLARRSADVGERVMPFWHAVCEAARAEEPDEEARREICPME